MYVVSNSPEFSNFVWRKLQLWMRLKVKPVLPFRTVQSFSTLGMDESSLPLLRPAEPTSCIKTRKYFRISGTNEWRRDRVNFVWNFLIAQKDDVLAKTTKQSFASWPFLWLLFWEHGYCFPKDACGLKVTLSQREDFFHVCLDPQKYKSDIPAHKKTLYPPLNRRKFCESNVRDSRLKPICFSEANNKKVCLHPHTPLKTHLPFWEQLSRRQILFCLKEISLLSFLVQSPKKYDRNHILTQNKSANNKQLVRTPLNTKGTQKRPEYPRKIDNMQSHFESESPD